MTLLLILAICAIVVTVLWSPFRRRAQPAEVSPEAGTRVPLGPGPPAPLAPGGADASDRELRPLLELKDRVFTALADLRFDFESGKLSREDFEQEDARLRARALEVLRDLDRRAPSVAGRDV
ncbi:MAG: hypothetical protein ABR599_07310 [Gemmatimonadota bacterium]